MEPNKPAANNYLYYVIEDKDKKVRGHVIGVQHWVEPKDQNFNPQILEAINQSARVILEIPPDSEAPLLPPESEAVFYKIMINKIIEDLTILPEQEVSTVAEVERLLKEIEEKSVKAGNKQGFDEVKKRSEEISKIEDKVKFLKEIQKYLFDFNLVSLERNINKKVAEANKKIKPLELENLNNKLQEANLKLGLRKIKEKMIEADFEKIKDKLNQSDSIFEKLEFINNKKNELGIKDTELSISEEEIQVLKEETYRAWVDGDVVKLRELIQKSHEIFKEEPEFEQVHQPRDKQMAERIIKAVNKAKEKNTEVAIMMGCGHLLQKRTNIIDYLHESFKNDLKGWSITQIKRDTY